MKTEDVRQLDTPSLVPIASRKDRSLARVYAIDELARRALDDARVLPDAVAAISAGRGHELLQGGLPIGYMGALTLLDAGRDEVTLALLQAMRDWSRQEAMDLLGWWAGKRLDDTLAAWKARFGWEPPDTASSVADEVHAVVSR